MAKRPETDFSRAECQPYLLEGGEHALLMIHGFTGSAAHLRPLGERLHRMGYTVRGINLPGHATRMEDMRACTWLDWLQAAKNEFAALKEKYPKVSVAGLSMGGVLSLLLAEQMDVTAAVTLSAPMAVQNKLMPLARLASPFMPVTWWKSRPADGVQLDPRYDLGYAGFPTRSAADLSRLIRMARHDLYAVTCPLLVVQSHGDETIAEDSGEVILRGISSERKGILWLEDAPHVCTLTDDIDVIAGAMGELLQGV